MEPDKKVEKNVPGTSMFSEEKKPSGNVPEEKSVMSESVLVGQMDAYIKDRINAQPKTVEDILSVKEVHKPGRHRLSLPEELIPYAKDFEFRWVLKDKRSIDDHFFKGWVIVNAVLFPDVPRHKFTITGAIEEGDLIMCCLARRIYEARKKEERGKSSEMVQSAVKKHETDPETFYKPKLSSKELENDDAGDIQEGRDF